MPLPTKRTACIYTDVDGRTPCIKLAWHGSNPKNLRVHILNGRGTFF